MRLLFAEDEAELSNAVCAVLRRSNYTVDAVYDGEEALDYLRTGVYDAAVLDIMMPRMDGVSVLKAARAEGLSLPVLFLRLLVHRVRIGDHLIQRAVDLAFEKHGERAGDQRQDQQDDHDPSQGFIRVPLLYSGHKSCPPS